VYLDRKPLAFSQLASSKADVYRPPYATKGYVQNVTLHNTGASAETVTLYYDDGTLEHQWLSQSVAAKDSFVLALPGEGFVVEPGAKITGSADTAGTVTCKLSGTEESESRVVGVESNLWCPPATPHAMDMEFDTDVLDDWKVYNFTASAVGSLSDGAIDAYDTTFTSGNVVRVAQDTLQRRSWLQVQPPASGQTFGLAKAYTFPTNVLVWARMRFNLNTSIVNNDSSISLRFFTDSGGGYPGLDYYVSMFLNECDAGLTASLFLWRDTVTKGFIRTTDVDAQGQALEYVAIHKLGSTYHFWVGTSAGNWIYVDSVVPGFTPDMVGITTRNVASTTPAPQLHGVDFIRFIETDNFLL